MQKNKTICLNMIVKNESAIIEETLQNILDHIPIDYWVISDTGSTDNTIAVITNFFKNKNIPGEIHHDSWINFGHNRNAALQYCHGKSDYVFFFDADDRFYGNFTLPEDLNKDVYFFNMKVDQTNIAFSKALLVKNSPTFFWRGIIHEFLEIPQHIKSIGQLNTQQYFVNSGKFGARSQVDDKAARDAATLEQAFFNPDEDILKPRYAFFAGKAFMKAKNPEKAIEWFTTYLSFNIKSEETFDVFVDLGKLYEFTNQSTLALETYLKGFELYPQRLENAFYAIHLLRNNDQLKQATNLIHQAQHIKTPTNVAYIGRKDIYDYLFANEAAYVSALTGDFKTSILHIMTVLKNAPLDLKTQGIRHLLNCKQHMHLLLRRQLKELKQVLLKHYTETNDTTAHDLITFIDNLLQKNRKLKLLFVHPFLMVGGVETVLKSYLNALVNHPDFEVDLTLADHSDNSLYSGIPQSIKNKTLLNAIESQFLSLTHQKVFDSTLSQTDMNYYKSWYFGIRHELNNRLITQINETDYDVIIDFKNTFFSHFIDALPQINVPILYWIHSHDYFDRFKNYLPTYQKIIKQINGIVSICHDMNTFTKKELNDLSINTTHLTLSTLYNPIDTDLINQKALVSTTQVDQQLLSEPFILNVARLYEPQKNHIELLEIYKEMKDLGIKEKLYIIGNGPSYNLIKNKILELGLENDCLLLGEKDNPYPFMKAAKIFVHTANYEGFPTVLLECMALKTPIVTYNCPTGPREILDNGHYGKLIPLHNKIDFINASIELLQNTSLRETISQSAYQSLDRFKTNVILNELWKTVDNTLDQ